MSLTAAVIRELIAAGLEGMALADACQRIEDAAPIVIDEAAERRRAADRERKRAMRLRNSADSAEQKAPPVSPLSLSPTPPIPNPPISPQKQNNMAGARAELEKVLPPDLSQAVIDHRRAIRKPLTAHAAKLLAREFAKCEDPVSSAETMISQGWQGFKADWSTEAIPRKAQYPHRENYVDVAKRLGWFDAEQDADDAFSNVEFLPAVNRGR